ncbi:hypothetical protein DIW83_12910 [Acinetobacter nosocomialis]|uniref:Uncharacterized protein n=1 Tax=Acinetobacter higginsii TaxID=70347 RepID=N9RL87_9GAMM|nr:MULTISPECIES: hypothetical protein [Acinetobacter]AWL19862.1 hypothetical protein DIW83_12910 [Acinetobacter nosocomialis]ENW82238.1 hypothetical protein F909_01315 [Acinetobacter sp. ANC 3929]ENX58704.1 hypothetical protein F902_01328 [Acinetobacter higginsii]
MQYSKNLFIQQISETEFVLQVNDSKLAEELELRLPNIFGRYISEPKSISNGQELEYHFSISGVDLNSFQRHLTTLTPELLDSLSSH